MTQGTVRYKGKTYVLVERSAYQRIISGGMPELPRPDRQGNVPAVAYARASIAREIIARRIAAGLTQGELARLAGVRLETVNRVERGKNTPSTSTIAKLDAALAAAEAPAPRPNRPAVGASPGSMG